jgi:hypothetical protein
MLQNVGGMDREIRIVLGIGLLVLGLLHVLTGTLEIVAYIVGGVAITSGVVRFCPAWSVFGINTSAGHK